MKKILLILSFLFVTTTPIFAQTNIKTQLISYIQQLRNLADSLEKQVSGTDFDAQIQNSLSNRGFDAPVAAKTYYVDSIGRIFWQQDLPVYLVIAPNENGTDGTMLKSVKKKEMEAYSNPMRWEGHGIHYIKHQDASPNQSVEFEVWADGISPISRILLKNAPKYVFQGTTFYGKGLIGEIVTSDELSGVRQTLLSIDSAAYNNYLSEITLDQNKPYDLRFYGIDRVGNTEAIQNSRFIVDLEAPKTTYAVEGDQLKDIYSPRTTISLSSKDVSSGVNKIYYSFNGEAYKIYTGTLTLDKMPEGDYEMMFYAVDNVENKEEIQKFSFFLDKTPPAIVAEIKGDQFQNRGRVYISNRTQMQLTASDNKSEVDRIYFAIDGERERLYREPFPLIKSEGTHIIKYSAVDKVNNKNEMQTTDSYSNNVFLDLSLPEISHTLVGPQVFTRDTTFVNSTTKVQLNSNDKESGIQKVGYKINEGRGETYNEAFVIDKEGVQKVDYYAMDNVNNRISKDFVVVVDNQGPEINFSFSTNATSSLQSSDGTDKTIPVYPVGTTIYLAATDVQIGIDNIFVAIDGKPETIYTMPIKLTQKGLKSLKVRAADQLGNSTMSELIEIFVK